MGQRVNQTAQFGHFDGEPRRTCRAWRIAVLQIVEQRAVPDLHSGVDPHGLTPQRIEQNLAVFDFHLSEPEMAAIEPLDVAERTGPDPDTFVRPPS